MITPSIKKIVENNVLALATVSQEGRPHCIALGYVKVINSRQLLVTNNYMRQTIQNISRIPQVALAVWSRDWEKNCVGYELMGTAEYFTSGPWVDRIKKIPENRGELCRGAIVITVSKIKKLG